MTSPSSAPQQFEIEIKSLLGSQANAAQLQEKLAARFPDLQVSEESKQLNHYFVGDNFAALSSVIGPHLSTDKQAALLSTIQHGKNISVRTRQLNDKVIFVMKASIDDTTSSNGISRLEFEAEVTGLSLEQLDQLLLDAGFQYQAKWSRERTSYKLGDGNGQATSSTTISLDKNAGYGYLAEFESLVDDAQH